MGGELVESIIRFHSALRELTGLRGIRDDVSRYEAMSLALLEMAHADLGALLPTFPAENSPLRLQQLFETLYLRYDERFVYAAPDLKASLSALSGRLRLRLSELIRAARTSTNRCASPNCATQRTDRSVMIS